MRDRPLVVLLFSLIPPPAWHGFAVAVVLVAIMLVPALWPHRGDE